MLIPRDAAPFCADAHQSGLVLKCEASSKIVIIGPGRDGKRGLYFFHAIRGVSGTMRNEPTTAARSNRAAIAVRHNGLISV